MKCELNLSLEELSELEKMLQRELENGRTALRRGHDARCRGETHKHMQLVEHILGEVTRVELQAASET